MAVASCRGGAAATYWRTGGARCRWADTEEVEAAGGGHSGATRSATYVADLATTCEQQRPWCGAWRETERVRVACDAGQASGTTLADENAGLELAPAATTRCSTTRHARPCLNSLIASPNRSWSKRAPACRFLNTASSMAVRARSCAHTQLSSAVHYTGTDAYNARSIST